MPITTLRPRLAMDAHAKALAKEAVARLEDGPLTEGAVYIRLMRLPRRQYLAFCDLAGSAEPHVVTDFAIRVTGLKAGAASASRRVAELDIQTAAAS